MLIIIAFAVYRTYDGRSRASIRKPNEQPLHKDSVELNPMHASFDQSKLRMSFLYEKTDLDQDQNNRSRASPFRHDATLSVQAPRHDDQSSNTSYEPALRDAPGYGMVPVKRGGDSSASFDNNEGYDIAVNSSNFYQSRGPSASPYYSELKNADGSPYVVQGDAMMDSYTMEGTGLMDLYTIEGSGLQEVLASRQDARYDISTPSKIKPRKPPGYYSSLKHADGSPYEDLDDAMVSPCSAEGNSMHEVLASRRDTHYDMSSNGDYSSLDGTQEVFARGHFPGTFDSYDVTVKTAEP